MLTNKDAVDFIAETLKKLEGSYEKLSQIIGMPLYVTQGPIAAFRYEEKTDQLLCFLKGIKIVSTLNASLLLFKNGHLQEMSALCRIAEDCGNDVLFMLQPTDGEDYSSIQRRFFEDFFQEEFSDPEKPFNSQNKRATVSRQKIHAAFSRAAASITNPSDTQKIQETIHGVGSGYIHGAYPHIMELFWGSPVKMNLNGLKEVIPMSSTMNQLVNQTYRGLMTSVFVARKVGDVETAKELRVLTSQYEETLNCGPKEPVDALLKKAKTGK